MIKSSVYDCSVIELPINHREKGNLTVVENGKNIPFDVRRVYYLYDVPAGEARGGHAHRELRQLIVAASGSFNVVLFDGNVKRTITLNRPFYGLLVVPGIWRELDDFSSGSVCLVMASHEYDEKDYIRDYKEYLVWKDNTAEGETK
jgi:dTDP-4-dehydrorhamnose 3,5-epimerase-like enzyme